MRRRQNAIQSLIRSSKKLITINVNEDASIYLQYTKSFLNSELHSQGEFHSGDDSHNSTRD